MRVGRDKLAMAGNREPRGFFAMASAGLLAGLLSASATCAGLADDNLPPPPTVAGGNIVRQAPPAAAAAPTPSVPQVQIQPQAQMAPGQFPAQPPPPAERPGFIYAFGRWWDSARGKLGDFAKPPNEAAKGAAEATQDAMKNAAKATQDAVNALIRLPGARFIETHERCALAPNGAPDCRTAAAKACRVKGFSGGHPINVQSSENCPPAVWMSGRGPAAGECPEETVVLMAACD
jgi:hypothetical protein